MRGDATGITAGHIVPSGGNGHSDMVSPTGRAISTSQLERSGLQRSPGIAYLPPPPFDGSFQPTSRLRVIQTAGVRQSGRLIVA